MEKCKSGNKCFIFVAIVFLACYVVALQIGEILI